VSSDYVIAEFDLKTLAIRNATQTNLLNFKPTPTEIEVPLKVIMSIENTKKDVGACCLKRAADRQATGARCGDINNAST